MFLAAEHCDEGVDRVEVTFASSFDRQKSTTYWGTWHGDPAYSTSQGDPHDIAVVVLDTDVAGAESITPARLPLRARSEAFRGRRASPRWGTARRRSPTVPEARRSTTPTSAMSPSEPQLADEAVAADLAERIHR